MEEARKIVIMGAGGRDFHVFNTCYRGDPSRRVVAFTAGQIPHIDARTYPASLAGPGYPRGIPIVPEAGIDALVRREEVDEVVFAYSDVSYRALDEWKGRIEELGARFSTFDPDGTMLPVERPSVAVCAVRTGAGKSPVSRRVSAILVAMGRRPVVVRHPMPYGNLRQQVVQRFATADDFRTHRCTIEEMEEYEPHVANGQVVFAGVDYAQVFEAAAAEGDLLVWDGGNNDTPFLRPDLWITVVDPLRPGHELTWFPGRINLERADVVVINKVDEARPDALERVRQNVRAMNPRAQVVETRSEIALSDPDAVRGRRALVVEDGPTTTHGGMGYGAGLVAALRHGASGIVDPRPFLRGELEETFRQNPHLRAVLPAVGYGEGQLRDLRETIERSDCDVVVIGTPVDLARVLDLKKPSVRVSYEIAETSRDGLRGILEQRFGAARPAAR